jgi:hypothetical protein
MDIRNLLSYSVLISYVPLEITNSHKQNGFEMKVLILVLIPDLHSIIVPQYLQIFNQRPKISIDAIPRLLCPRYQS